LLQSAFFATSSMSSALVIVFVPPRNGVMFISELHFQTIASISEAADAFVTSK